MAETIRTYLMSDPFHVIEMDREAFYDDQMKVWRDNRQPTRIVETVAIFLFNNTGKLVVQKRSREKRHNPKANDKTVGGHMNPGNSLLETVFYELIQEMRTPSTVHFDHEIFMKYLNELSRIKNALEKVAVVKFIDTGLHMLKRVIDDEEFIIASKTHFFLGFYDGGIFPADDESSGCNWVSLEELEKDIKDEKELFTNDLLYFLEIYKKEIEEFLALRN